MKQRKTKRKINKVAKRKCLWCKKLRSIKSYKTKNHKICLNCKTINIKKGTYIIKFD